jgi:hypothetical protein
MVTSMPLNLVHHREGPDVWHRRGVLRHSKRWAAALVSGGLMAEGLRRRSRTGWLMVAAGAGLAIWTAAGFSAERHGRTRLRIVRARPAGADEAADAYIAETSQASFPASDPPSWTSIGTAGPADVPSA